METKSDLLIYLLLLSVANIGTVCAADAPEPAKNVGYVVNTFSEGFSSDNIDLSQRPLRGKAWYPWSFFGWRVSNDVAKLNGDGSAEIVGAKGGHNAQLATASIDPVSKDIIGRAFGGGGYFEAELSFDADSVLKFGPSNGWPSFWSLTHEILARRGGSQWPGQENWYEQYIEVDFFEYNMAFNGVTKYVYGTDVHHFYGIFHKTCKNWLCDYGKSSTAAKAFVPDTTDFREYHKYGFLWVPERDGLPGYGQHYFDGVPVGTKITWKAGTADEMKPPPNGKFWAYSLLDRQHLVIILGAGPTAPMRVRRVNVWQKSGSNNIVN
jgi:hypothetical protein